MQEKNNSIIKKYQEFASKNIKLFALISFYFFTFLLIMMFVMILVPPNAAISESNLVYWTPFHAVKFFHNSSSYLPMLAPFGWVILILWIVGAFLLTTYLVGNWTAFKNEYASLNDKEDKRNYWIRKSFLISYGVIFIILFFMMIIPPNYKAIANAQYLFNQQSNGLIACQNGDIQTALWILENVFNFTGTAPTTVGAISNLLAQQVIPNTFWFNPITWYIDGGVTITGGYWACVSLFIIFFSFGFLGILFNVAIEKHFNIKFNFHFDAKRFKEMQTKYREAKENKNKIKEAKRIIDREENSLLQNLYDVNLDIENSKKGVQTITQDELREKIAQNNNIKKQLEQLKVKKDAMKKEILAQNKLRSALNKFGTSKVELRKQRREKQKISIPDKELDEIFRSLEID